MNDNNKNNNYNNPLITKDIKPRYPKICFECQVGKYHNIENEDGYCPNFPCLTVGEYRKNKNKRYRR